MIPLRHASKINRELFGVPSGTASKKGTQAKRISPLFCGPYRSRQKGGQAQFQVLGFVVEGKHEEVSGEGVLGLNPPA